jgi:hypothetical protein
MDGSAASQDTGAACLDPATRRHGGVLVSIPRSRRPALVLGLLLVSASIAPAPAPPDQGPAPDLSAMLEARHRAAVDQFEETWVYYKQARSDAYPVYVWSRFVLEARFDMSDKKPDRIAALEAHLDRMKKLEALVKKVRRLGFGQAIEVGATEYYRIEAEYWLAHERARAG